MSCSFQKRRSSSAYPPKVYFLNSIYNRVAALLACFLLGITLVIVGRIPGTKGFVVLLRRWVVERTLMLVAKSAADQTVA